MGEKRTVLIVGATVVFFVGLLTVWAFAPGSATGSDSLIEITEPAEIEKYVGVSRITIATSENYMGHRIRVINGILTNVSDKPLRMIELKLIFLDYDGNPLIEDVQMGFQSQKPLNPGEPFRFGANFENLPREWNHRIPNVEITRIGL